MSARRRAGSEGVVPVTSASRLTAYATTAFLARTGIEAVPATMLLVFLGSGRPPLHGALMVAATTASAAVSGPVVGAVLDSVRRPAMAYAVVLVVVCCGLLALAPLVSWAPLGPLMAVAVLVGVGQPALSGALTAQLGRIVPTTGLPRALSMDVAVFSVAGMAGPALAGIGVALTASGELVLAACPFALALVSLGRIRLPWNERRTDRRLPPLGAGMRALVADPVLREVTVVTSFTAVGQAGVVIAAPLLSRHLTGGLGWTGVLLTTLAAGNLTVAVISARWPLPVRPERIVRTAACAYAVLLCLLAVAPGKALTLAVAFATGAVTGPLVAALFLSRFQRSPSHLQAAVFGTAAGLRSLSYACGAAVLGLLAVVDVRWCLLGAGAAQVIGLLLGALSRGSRRPEPVAPHTVPRQSPPPERESP